MTQIRQKGKRRKNKSMKHLAVVTMEKYETSATIRSLEQKARWKEDNMETMVFSNALGLL